MWTIYVFQIILLYIILYIFKCVQYSSFTFQLLPNVKLQLVRNQNRQLWRDFFCMIIAFFYSITLYPLLISDPGVYVQRFKQASLYNFIFFDISKLIFTNIYNMENYYNHAIATHIQERTVILFRFQIHIILPKMCFE